MVLKPLHRPLPKVIGKCDICEEKTWLMAQCRVSGLKACPACYPCLESAAAVLREAVAGQTFAHPPVIVP